ncbi:DUF418 domain-containing protein [Colwellia psychrerythraea]|uniref:DUF418 domain-containing protein n=1 Tax=Colwellia psychrerythraea TaxID=28229 RepID=A0A099KUP8_COLPS|nr:DUF418 domain-containing protein [Colwellia psychrerythraea]KGJ93920.1 protein of unknown function DUF418 [Colwellia psychrerythraea]
MKQRIIGFDIARAFAIFGMVIVNFKIAMNAEAGNEFLLVFASLFEGRASALFVVLAGIGITFLTNKARQSQDSTLIIRGQKTLIKRGVLLIFIGLAYTSIWPADILHYYGFYFLIAALVFNSNDRNLLIVATLIMALFPTLMIFFNYENGWDWTTLTYQGFWTVDGMVRHIIFNGFHPVLPWCAFLLLGMWLGRQNLTASIVRKKILVWCLAIWGITELIFFAIRAEIGSGEGIGLTIEEVEFLFSTSIIPPMPQYVIAAGSLAVVIIICCLYLSEKFSERKLIAWLYQTGQLSLTLYVAHVIIGMGVLEATDHLRNQSIGFSLLSSLLFCISGITLSVLWLKYFKTGPLEWVFRKIAS